MSYLETNFVNQVTIHFPTHILIRDYQGSILIKKQAFILLFVYLLNSNFPQKGSTTATQI